MATLQRILRLTLASGALLLFAHAASAATITGTLTTIASGLSGPLMFTVPIGPTPVYAYNALDGGTGVAASFSGFPSLVGVTPSDLTLSFGDLERLSTTFTPGGCTPVAPPAYSNCDTVTNTYSDVDASPSYFDVVLAGTGTILTGTILSVDVITDTDLASPGFATGTGSGTILFTGGLAPYFAEVLSLSGGTGLANLSLDAFDPVCLPGTDPCGFVSGGTLTLVPESSTVMLLGSALAALSVTRRRRATDCAGRKGGVPEGPPAPRA